MRETVTLTVKQGKDDDGLLREVLLVNGEERIHAGSLNFCPEDAILERDLIGPSDIVSFLKSFLKNHNGKKLIINYEEMDEDE